MSISSDYLKELENQGIYLFVQDNKLKFKAEKFKMTKEVMSFLKEYKQEIIDSIKAKDKKNECEFHLTPIQRAYILGKGEEYELGGISAHYYLEYYCKNLNVSKFEKALNNTVKKNDALRLIFTENIMQKVVENVPYYKVETKECSNYDEVLKVREILAHKSYERDEWPLFTVKVSHISSYGFYIHISFDCIILDALSARMFILKVLKEYRGIKVKEHGFTFKDYMENLQEYTDKKVNYEKAIEYWSTRINKMPMAPKLKLKKPIKEVKKPYFKRLEYTYTSEETGNLYKKMQKFRFTGAAVIATAFLKTLSRFSENKDITINVPIFNRFLMNSEVNNILGDFTNIGFLSYFNDKNKNFQQEIKEIQGQLWKLLQYRYYDGTRILKELNKEQVKKSIIPIVFTCVINGTNQDEIDEDFKEVYSISQTPQVYLDHHVRDDGGRLKISWDYAEQLFNPGEIQKVFNVYKDILYQIINSDNWDNINICSKD